MEKILYSLVTRVIQMKKHFFFSLLVLASWSRVSGNKYSLALLVAVLIGTTFLSVSVKI